MKLLKIFYKSNLYSRAFYTCLFAITSMSFTLHAAPQSFSEKVWHKEYGPGFEIQNKSQPIWVAVAADKDLKQSFKVEKNSKKSLTISPKATLTIGVFKRKPTVLPKGFAFNKFVGSSQPDYRFTINADAKTKYVTWNPDKYKTPAKSLYPQTGPYLGLSGKTDSGYSLAKNIRQADIKLQK